MKKKLLFIMGGLESGGGEKSLINLLQLIDYNIYDIDLILFKERGVLLEEVPKEVKILSYLKELHFMYDDSLKNAFSFKHIKLSLIHIIGTIISKIKSKSGFHKGQYRWEHYYKSVIPKLDKFYDVAISYLEGESMLYLVDKVEAKRKVAWVHTDYSKINSDTNLDLKYFNKIDKIVSISDVCVDVLKKMFPSVSEKIIYLPNLTSSKSINVKAEQFYPKEFSRESNAIKLLSIGRLIKLKGFDIALEAAKILKEKGIKFKWYVIGDGILYEELEKYRKELNLEDFIFLGIRKNPYPYLKNADIVIQPSRYEGKSMVLDEAKILKKPIVVTNYDTVHDQIKENEGIIVDINAEALSIGIEKMIYEKEKYIEYLNQNDYGNQDEILKYYEIFDKD